MINAKLKPIQHASIHSVGFGEFSFSPAHGHISRNHAFCRCGCLPWTWLARTVKFIGIWILNPRKTSGGQPMAFGGFGIWLGGYFVSWILILDPSVLSPWNASGGQPVVFGLSGNPAPPKVINLAQFKQTCLGSLKHAVSNVPGVCSRTPLIIFVFWWIWRLWDAQATAKFRPRPAEGPF